MKKALSVFLMLALVGSVFAAEPVADVNIAEFTGDASVQWGIDFENDYKTGFKNSASVSLKLNLLNEGSKSTTGDGVWGELVIKTNGDTFAKATNTSSLGVGLGSVPMTVVVDTAKLHIGPAYVGITSGDTQTGELKMDSAVKSEAVGVKNVGPNYYSRGITLGYTHDMFNIASDLRSFNPASGHVYVVTWEDAKGVSQREIFADVDKSTAEKNATDKLAALQSDKTVSNPTITYYGEFADGSQLYNNSYAFAFEAEFTGVENLSVKAGVSYNFGENATVFDKGGVVYHDDKDVLGYSASAGYKMALNDTFYLRPQVGFTGSHDFTKNETENSYNVAGGLLFGWGDTNIDDNAGVYFLDDDAAKKVSPGVGVVVKAPIAEGAEITIAPSFFSGDIIPGLTAATYGEIVVPTAENGKLKFTVLNGMKYAIPVGAGTITPQIGTKYTNAAYVGPDAKKDSLNLKVGVEAAGFVSNTTFYTIYESNNLLDEGYGTLNFGTKISF